ncbi:MAG: hypothetical protein FDW93_01560 [Bergeyella sp.]|nr:hypothetical protein [Bergeyella sp.]
MVKNVLSLIAVVGMGVWGSAQVGINTANPRQLFHVDGAKDNPTSGIPTQTQQANDFVVKSTGQTSIGDINPSDYSMLNVSSLDKKRGITIPKVDLTSITLDLNSDGNDDVSDQPVGLLIFNNGKTFPHGYYFWTGKEWQVLNSSSVVPAQAKLNCESALLDPSQAIDGDTPKPIISGTVMKIYYSGANGGRFNGITLTSKGNLNIKATIADGKLENGSGVLVFAVQGIPTAEQTSPKGITFDLTPLIKANPGLKGCTSVTVGTQVNADIKTVAVMDYMKFVTDPDTGVKGFTVDATTPDGLYTIKVFMRHSIQSNAATETNNTYPTDSPYENNVLLRNNSSEAKVIMWNYYTIFGGSYNSGILSDAGGNLRVPPRKPGGAPEGGGNTWLSLSVSYHGGWGNPGIYNAVSGGPEYRRYTWIDTSSSTKVAYNVTVMSGMDPSFSKTQPTKQKVFIKIEQITGGS